jgi:hypothetical protein
VWARSRGDGGEAVAALKEWTSHRCVPEGNRICESLRVFCTGNLGSRASYSHGGRGPPSTDLLVTPLIKTLREV